MCTASPALDALLAEMERTAPDATRPARLRAIGDACTDMLAEGIARMRAASWHDEVVERATLKLARAQ